MAITPLKVLVSKVVFGSFICTQSRYNLLLASVFHVRTGKNKKLNTLDLVQPALILTAVKVRGP